MKIHRALVALVPLAGAAVLSAPAAAVSSQTLARDPYVTDLTASSAYVNWGLTRPTAGSVVVQKANRNTTCPTTIGWSAGTELKAGITDPLVNTVAGTTTTPWNYTVAGVTEYQESVYVQNLSPSTLYCYAVFPSQTSAFTRLGTIQSFKTLAPTGVATNVTFDVLGDTGENSTGPNPNESAIYNEIGASGAQFLLMAGDVGYSGGTETDYGDLSHTGSQVSNIFGPSYFPLAQGIPTFVADGNHGQNSDDIRIWPQVQTTSSSNGSYLYGPPPAPVDGITNDSPSSWYAVQDGNVRLYVLDAAWADSGDGTTTNPLCGPAGSKAAKGCLGYQADADEHWQQTSSEAQWLANDLAAHPGGVKMAVFHYPVASDASSQQSDPYLGLLRYLLALGNVKVVFNGHSHNYQRTQGTPGGSATFVTGGGGGTLQPVLGGSTCKAFEKAWGSVYAVGWSPGSGKGSSCGQTAPLSTAVTNPDQVYNFLRVSVSGTLVTVQAFNAASNVPSTPFDTVSVSY